MNHPENLGETLDQVIGKVRKINPNFAVLSRLSSYLSDPDTDIEDIEELIKSDQSLTADIIAISNSALYGAVTECSDIGSALSRIGFNDVLRVVSLLMSKAVSSKPLQYYDLSPHQVWMESVSVSFLMEGFSALASLNKAMAATSGVVHNLGRVLTDEIITMFPLKSDWDGVEPIAEWEDENIGINYGEAGARFLEDMNFPEEIQYVVRHHVYPGAAMRANPICHFLRYSVALFKAAGFGFANEDFEVPDVSILHPGFSLSEEEILEVVDFAKTRFKEINSKILVG